MGQSMKMQLGQVSKITPGPSGSLLDDLQDGPDGVPVISPSDLTERNTVDGRHVRRVPWDRAKRLARFSLQEGDLLVVRQGSLGRVALISDEQAAWVYSSSFLRIRPRSDIVLPEYLLSYLTYPPVQKDLLSQANPGKISSLNSTMLNELSIVVPPIEQQQAVIEALNDIDSQIAIQRAIADRLDILKPAIFGEMIKGVRHS